MLDSYSKRVLLSFSDRIEVEASDLFEDACDDFYKIENILNKFNVWRLTDMESYKDAFVSSCLPKVFFFSFIKIDDIEDLTYY